MTGERRVFERRNRECSNTPQIHGRIEAGRRLQRMAESDCVLGKHAAVYREKAYALGIVSAQFVDAIGILQYLAVRSSPTAFLSRPFFIQRGRLILAQFKPAE